jgi:hypothetical protein
MSYYDRNLKLYIGKPVNLIKFMTSIEITNSYYLHKVSVQTGPNKKCKSNWFNILELLSFLYQLPTYYLLIALAWSILSKTSFIEFTYDTHNYIHFYYNILGITAKPKIVKVEVQTCENAVEWKCSILYVLPIMNEITNSRMRNVSCNQDIIYKSICTSARGLLAQILFWRFCRNSYLLRAPRQKHLFLCQWLCA